ncbi:MAG: hypothetical protein Q9195_006720 [Heterodermia aff. obscurata]
MADKKPPFSLASQLHTLTLDDGTPLAGSKHLPSQPRIKLADIDALKNFLQQDLCTPVLDRLAPHLYMISTPSGSNISPLHYQRVKSRQIILTEDPRLHLVWYHDRIFVKPLPTYLLSYSFWERYLCNDNAATAAAASPFQATERQRLANAARGLLRTYFYLIRHESDFRIAQHEELQLVPKDVTWERFCDFSTAFNEIWDQDVAERYHYGELRLSRLNYLVKLFLIGRDYQEVNWQYSEYFARYYGPLLFVFGVLSVLLSAMQVGLAVEQLQSHHWTAMYRVYRWFSVAILCALGAVLAWLIGLALLRPFDELAYTVKMKSWKRSKGNTALPSLQSGQASGNQMRTV